MRDAYRTRIAKSSKLSNEVNKEGLTINATRKRSDTHHRLLAEAIRMFGTQGFESTTMRDLGTAVGIKAPAIYNHYQSKEDILAAALIWVIEDFNEQVLGPDNPKDDCITRLRGMLQRHLLYETHNPTIAKANDVLVRSGVLVRMQRPESQNEVLRLTRIYMHLLSDLVEDTVKKFGKNVSPLKPAINAIATMYDQAFRWYHPDGPISESELIDIYWQFTARILGISDER